MEELVFELLIKRGMIDIGADSVATNQIRISGNEVIISGNTRGLILLADYLVQIALSDTPHKHIHLDFDNFFDTATCELIIAKE